MELTVKDIRKIKPGTPLVKQLDSRLACTTMRNLVSYVNNNHPVEGYRYTTHVTKDNIVAISLIER